MTLVAMRRVGVVPGVKTLSQRLVMKEPIVAIETGVVEVCDWYWWG